MGIKKYSYLLLSMFIFIIGISNTNASTQNVDFTKKGSIEITLTEKNENTPIEGVEITIYHVANAILENNNLSFELSEQITKCDSSLTNANDKELIKKVSKCNLEEIPSYKSITNNKGKVNFDNLILGLYLVKQTNIVEGYSNIDSFLIMIPKEIEKNWTYNIKSEPKTEVYKMIDLVVKKEWNSSSNNIPKEVTIELLKDDETIDVVKLNEENNWTYTWKNIEKSDKYSIKEINIPKGYKASYKVDGFVYTVTNTDTLAYTGQIFYPIIILSVVGIILIASGIKVIKQEA